MNALQAEVSTPSSKLTLLSFENDWCAQCYTERPIIQKVAEEYAGQLLVQSVNVTTDTTLSDLYKIKTAPSIVFIKDGLVVEKITRFIDYDQLDRVIRYYL